MANFEKRSETLEGYEQHLGGSRQYVRDIILGVNDGLVSTFLLVSAVVGGGLNTTQILLTGVAGGIAGMVSMSIGEYLATKSQDEVLVAELELEKTHLQEYREHERDQLSDMLSDMGLLGDDLDTVVRIIDSSDEVMLNMHAALEFGVVDTERRSPYSAAVASGLLFLLGAMPSVLPFAIWENTLLALLMAAIFSGIGLFFVGAIKTRQTKKSWILSGLENLVLGLAAGTLSYFVGRAFDSLIG